MEGRRGCGGDIFGSGIVFELLPQWRMSASTFRAFVIDLALLSVPACMPDEAFPAGCFFESCTSIDSST